MTLCPASAKGLRTCCVFNAGSGDVHLIPRDECLVRSCALSSKCAASAQARPLEVMRSHEHFPCGMPGSKCLCTQARPGACAYTHTRAQVHSCICAHIHTCMHTRTPIHTFDMFVRADVASLQQPDGSFVGDQWGEVDTRFSYCALLCLNIIGRTAKINVDAAVHFIAQCKNFDGGFGCTPGTPPARP